MGTAYAEKERAFIASLPEDTGRTLETWLAGIAATGLTDRNDIIDWLRQSGFTFSNASWIERIHHNGGRLVYAENAAPAVEMPPPIPPARTAPAIDDHKALQRPSSRPSGEMTEPPLRPMPSAKSAGGFPDEISELLAAAKGLRPLATLALREIMALREFTNAVPETTIAAHGPLLMLLAPKPYLALLPGANALRFYGDFGPDSHGRVVRADAALKIASKAAPPFASVLVLTDARLVDAPFLDLVRAAHARAHS